ncbi:hypothetical protein NDN08_000399 [Rhodosorus marinus]|uniref:Gfo/Idh/MocA-like oxidoreductase N-terminal domain-containing protein n=1 Tax=Rhodosorus marinus TaxID=101924 RepID=A0AAV8UTF1_9RHOD|nr:hypothetical protein NDN08_000399 [Rhodosorus marinus]
MLGVGMISPIIGDALEDAPNAELVAVGSRTLARAEKFILRYTTAKAYGSYDAVLDDADVDIVYLPLPTSLCYEWTMKCAEKNKHVLVDKPLPPADQLKEMIEVCRSKGLVIMDGTHFVHSSRMQRIVEAARSGEIGKLRRVNCCCRWHMPVDNIRFKTELEPFGALGDLGWYCIKFGLSVCGFENKVIKVHADSVRHPETKSITAAVCSVFFEDGKSMMFDCEFNGAGANYWGEVIGGTGSMYVEDFVLPYKGSTAVCKKEELSPDFPYYKSKNLKITEEGNFQEIFPPATEKIVVTNTHGLSQCALMFEDFREAMEDPEKADRWAMEALATQTVLDTLYEETKRDSAWSDHANSSY